MHQEKIYNLLPISLQNVAISIFGYLWQKRRFGGIFTEQVPLFKLREKYTKEEWGNYKNEQLKKLVLYAFNTVPFYNNKYFKVGLTKIELENITLDSLHRLPYLEKDELRLFSTSILLANDKEVNGKFYDSSGSTGTPVKIYYSEQFHQKWSGAFEARVRNWAGVTRFDARGMIGGRRVVMEGNSRPPFYRYNYFEKQVYYSAYHISPTNASNYVEAMWKYKIQYMTGYAVSNYLLALYIKQQGLSVPEMKAVITSSEKLTLEMREVIQDVYQCKVFDGWSGVEACALVTECEHGSLHISEDVGIIEIIDENGNEVSEGETGEVVCTGFLNYDQPLIRYRIGDRMTKGSGTCKCGRNMPLIKEIEGRLEDIVTGPDGRQMVRFHGIFIGIQAIERAQVIQHSLSHIEIKIQNEISLKNEEIELINKRVISQLGDMKIDVVQHQKIDQTGNGKYKAVISHLI